MKLKKMNKVAEQPNTQPIKKKSLFSQNKSKEDQQKPKYSNLREVMDLQRPFSMMFSGVEDEKNFNILYDMGIRNFLISYHYVQRKHLSTQRYKEIGVKFFVDSGAYTYMNDINYEDYTIEQWEKHIEGYLKWARKNSDIIFAIANLDLEILVGGEQVQIWNEKYFEPFMLETGIPVCFIYHEEAPKLSWEQYCQRYPYVGVSLVTGGSSDTLKWCFEKLKVAEKYKSLVHGMGMTQTALLTKLPFYTVDSTTWLVGLQYGEINFWTGKKMSRLKKDKWKGAMLPQVVAKGFDEQKLLDEDKEEMVRVNVHAFIEAEEFVQEKLKSRMYWLRPDSVERSETDLDSIKYPSILWIENASNELDWEDYAKSFNISTEDKMTAINCIIDLTIFMNWEDDEYQPIIEDIYKPELIKSLHDMWVNRIVADDEERIADLKHFYTEVLLGKNDKLLVLGTNFDRMVKERDDYITDEEYETTDVTEMDLQNTMLKYLPAPVDGSYAPEISDLDDEIFREEGIEPVRDAQGRFIKGQKQVLKPKRLYSAKYPKMACDSCINAQKCPEYKAGYACAYNKMFERFNTRDMSDIIQAMQGIADFSMQRLQRGMITEIMEGGLPDPNVTNMMNQTWGYMAQLQRMYETGSQEVIRQTKIMRADGTQEMTTQVSNPQRGGILEKIFGDMGKDSTDDPNDGNVVN